MLSDRGLHQALIAVTDIEGEVRHTLETAETGANERKCCEAAHRNVVGLRKALQDWISVRQWQTERAR